jgi:TonB family protein
VAPIDQDLARWPRPTWLILIALLLSIQLAGIFSSSVPVKARTAYAPMPKFVALHTPRGDAADAWNGLDTLDDPLLFASADWNGFSGTAWMRLHSASNIFEEELPQPGFLTYEEAWRQFRTPLPDRVAARIDYHLEPRPLAVPEINSVPASSVRLEGGAAKRKLSQPLPLPPQYYNDVLGSSEVQVLIDPDGLVISARLLESSGLRKADQDAVQLAREARFSPLPEASADEKPEPEFGKLIFNWFALDFSSTNAVKR